MFLKLGLEGKVDFEPSQEKPFLHPEDRHSFMWVELMLDLSDRYTLKCVKTTI